MGSQEVLECSLVAEASAASCNDKSPQISNGVKESENQVVELLEDFDLYFEDIKNRLTISRMVSDSVIRGMVNAIEQEAAEKIAKKELEVARLKETIHLYHVGVHSMHYEPRNTEYAVYSSFPDTIVEHDRMKESIENLRNATKEQLKKLKKDIDQVRKNSPIRKISSGSELVGLGLGGILQEKVSEKWIDVDKTIDSLRTTVESMHKEMDDMVYLSKVSLYWWQLEREFQGEIEDMVITNCIRSMQKEFEEQLGERNTHFYGDKSVKWVEKLEEISGLRQELEVIAKSLSLPEIGQLAPHGSAENGDEFDNSKRNDHLQRKVSGNHVSSSTSLREGNGKHDEPIIIIPENVEFSQLKHMTREELLNYFKTEMTKMKRNHEHKVQEMTEEYFCLKREILRERGSSLPLRKDKEFDILRKKIPMIITRLDDILVENEKFPCVTNDAESIGYLKDKMDFLLSENHHLRDLLEERKREVNRLSSQVSDAGEKMLQHTISEANSLEIIENLKCAIEDANIEASISENVYQCLLSEMMCQMKCHTEESAAPTNCKYDNTSNCKYEDSDMESIIMQELCGVIFKEAYKEAVEEFSFMHIKYINENELRVSFETKAIENEIALRLEVAEKERKKEETLLLVRSTEEKEKLVLETTAALKKEKEQLELAFQELNILRDHTSQQQISILKISAETNIMKGKLVEALEQIESYKAEIHELKQNLELTKKELRETDGEKVMLLAATQEKQKMLSLLEAEERQHRKQMESIMVFVQNFSKLVADCEQRLAEDVKRSSVRLENLSSLMNSLSQKASILKRTGFQCKQRLERRCSDLQKAEAEVDLLGDEVDALLGLLAKIYIALDHYSPILQHYPGIIEILKLVKRELSGESRKSVASAC